MEDYHFYLEFQARRKWGKPYSKEAPHIKRVKHKFAIVNTFDLEELRPTLGKAFNDILSMYTEFSEGLILIYNVHHKHVGQPILTYKFTISGQHSLLPTIEISSKSSITLD